MIKVAVLGYGYWGPNLVRNFWETPDCRVVAVSDFSPQRLTAARRRYPAIETTGSPHELIARSDIDAVAIATPVATHFDLALAALGAGKHVLIEKPMTTTAFEAMRLIDEAERRAVVLMVDHTFVFTGAVQKIKEVVAAGGLGDIYYYDSVRVSLGLFQHDVNVIWDLAVHDLSIMDHVLPARPCAISATGMTHVPGSVENIAYLTAHFDNHLIAHIGVNWLAPVKVRQTLIGGSKRMIVYDDLEPSEKVKIYDKGITVNHETSPESVYRLLVGYRTGDMWAPQLDNTEALRRVVQEFTRCVSSGDRPETDGHAGLRIVRILEAATESLKARGRPVELEHRSLA